MKRVLAAVKVKDVEPYAVDMVKRLLNGEGYTAKFASAQLIPALFPQVSMQSQQELMK